MFHHRGIPFRDTPVPYSEGGFAMMDLVFDGATAGMLRCFYASQGVFDLDRRVCKLGGCGSKTVPFELRSTAGW